MNALGTLARSLWNLNFQRTSSTVSTRGPVQPEAGAKTLNAVRQQRVAGVLGLGRFRDGFEKLPQAVAKRAPLATETSFRPDVARAAFSGRDGFDGPVRRPVDLSGAMKTSASKSSQAEAKRPTFTASLDDLASLAFA